MYLEVTLFVYTDFLQCFPFLSFTVLHFMCKSIIQFCVNFCIWHQERSQLHFFACGYPTFSAKFVEKTLSLLNGFGILVENFRSYAQGLISELSNPFHWSLCHLCQYHIVLINTVSFEIRNCESFNLVLLKNVLAILGP